MGPAGWSPCAGWARLQGVVTNPSALSTRRSAMNEPFCPLANTFTLGVRDFASQRDFYRRLGLAQVFDSEDFVVFGMRGALLALFPLEKLAVDSRAQAEPGRGGIRFSIIMSVGKPEEVDAVADRAVKAGATLT